MSDKDCSEAGCSRPIRSRGYCASHYAMKRQRGELALLKPKTPLDRFFEKVRIGPAWCCWEWHGAVSTSGYSRFWHDGFLEQGHRFSYEAFVGPIPDGLTIDHLCRNKLCVNPYHLEAVTHKENNLRGNSVAGRYARRSHCKSGHPFNEANTHYRPDGSRRCRECNRANARKHKARKKART